MTMLADKQRNLRVLKMFKSKTDCDFFRYTFDTLRFKGNEKFKLKPLDISYNGYTKKDIYREFNITGDEVAYIIYNTCRNRLNNFKIVANTILSHTDTVFLFVTKKTSFLQGCAWNYNSSNKTRIEYLTQLTGLRATHLYNHSAKINGKTMYTYMSSLSMDKCGYNMGLYRQALYKRAIFNNDEYKQLLGRVEKIEGIVKSAISKINLTDYDSTVSYADVWIYSELQGTLKTFMNTKRKISLDIRYNFKATKQAIKKSLQYNIQRARKSVKYILRKEYDNKQEIDSMLAPILEI